MEQTCAKCANAIWCPTWAEYKCKAVLGWARCESDKPNDCKHFVKKDNTEEPKCHCEDCESQLPEDTV